MKGDFTRSRFEREKRFSGVRLQQGRVLLDEDFNAQLDIATWINRTGRRDVIGPSGVPIGSNGFAVLPVAPNDAVITPGRIWVNGLLCECPAGEWLNIQSVNAATRVITLDVWPADARELQPFHWIETFRIGGGKQYLRIASISPADRTITVEQTPSNASTLRWVVSFLTQPDVILGIDLSTIPPANIPPNGLLVYLDVWTRHITVLEDPSIREVALGGPDTSTRTKTIWQVRYDANVHRCDPPNISAVTGRLSAFSNPTAAAKNACEIPPSAGYRGIENQLYRVEIHDSGAIGGGGGSAPTYVWSRDNGSIAFAIVEPVTGFPKQLRLASIGRDERMSLKADDWVELIDDRAELDGRPGQLVQVDIPPQEPNRIVTLKDAVLPQLLFTARPRLRLWSGKDDVLAATDIHLENGVSIRFEAGLFRTGDYWTIPARSAFGRDTGDVLWPHDGATPPRPFPLPPEGIRHDYAALAVATPPVPPSTIPVARDCRPLFAPLTEMISLLYVSGDAQAATPDLTVSPRVNVNLPLPLKAGVFNGRIPVSARVRFRIPPGRGQLRNPANGAVSTNELFIATDAQGIATCEWSLDTTGDATHTVLFPVQTVEARLLDVNNQQTAEFITFHATLNIAESVALKPPPNCPDLANAHDVQRAIEILCEKDCCICTINVKPTMSWDELQRKIDEVPRAEICFADGEYDVPRTLIFDSKNYLKITGAGAGTRLTLTEGGDVFSFMNCDSVLVRDMTLIKTKYETDRSCLSAAECNRVVLENVSTRCAAGPAVDRKAERQTRCVTISGATTRAEVRFCRFEVGEFETALRLEDVDQAFVEDNVIVSVPKWEFFIPDTDPIPIPDKPDVIIKDIARTAIKSVVSDVVIAGPTDPKAINIGPLHVSVKSLLPDALLKEAMTLYPPKSVNDIASAQEYFRDLTVKLAKDVLRPQNIRFRGFLHLVPTEIRLGVAANCKTTKEVQLVGNRVESAIQGIAVFGDSERAVIVRNNIQMPSGSDAFQSIGIFASSRNQIIERNYLRSRQEIQHFTIGIWSFWEPKGRLPCVLLMIRENQIEESNIGIRFEVLQANGKPTPPAGVQWMIVDNLTLKGINNLLTASVTGYRAENNIVA